MAMEIERDDNRGVGKPDSVPDWVEGAENNGPPPAEEPTNEDLDSIDDPSGGGEDDGGDGVAVTDEDLAVPPTDRMAALEAQNATLQSELVAERRRYQEYLERNSRGGATNIAPAPVTASPADIQAMIDNPGTDPQVRAFLHMQLESARLQQENLEELKRIRARDEESTRAAGVEKNIARVTEIVDGIVKKHPILSNGHPNNEYAASQIRTALLGEYRRLSQSGYTIPDGDIGPAFQKLLLQHRAILRKTGKKPPKTEQDVVAEAIARKDAAGRETAPPAGGNSASAAKGGGGVAMGDPDNKRRFSPYVAKHRKKMEAQRRAAGMT